MASVRYIVSDIDKNVGFYRDILGFTVAKQAEGFAALNRDDLTLFLNVPGAGSAGKAGGKPQPGGWNRFQIETDDLDGLIATIRQKSDAFRGEVAEAAAGRQILLETRQETSSSSSSASIRLGAPPSRPGSSRALPYRLRCQSLNP